MRKASSHLFLDTRPQASPTIVVAMHLSRATLTVGIDCAGATVFGVPAACIAILCILAIGAVCRIRIHGVMWQA